jgi:hypothetical protein
MAAVRLKGLQAELFQFFFWDVHSFWGVVGQHAREVCGLREKEEKCKYCNFCWIGGFHSGDFEEYYFLGRDAV